MRENRRTSPKRKIPRDIVELLGEEIAYKFVYDFDETWFYHTITRYHGDH